MPLTSSLYVKGQLANVDRILVDVGTGYYAEKVCCGDVDMRVNSCAYLAFRGLGIGLMQADAVTARESRTRARSDGWLWCTANPCLHQLGRVFPRV